MEAAGDGCGDEVVWDRLSTEPAKGKVWPQLKDSSDSP